MTRPRYKETAFLDNVCSECGISYHSASFLLKHLARDHGIHLNPRPRYDLRPSKEYNFVEASSLPYVRRLIACPSCWFYCESQCTSELRDHIQDAHLNLLPKDYMVDESEMGTRKGRDFLAEEAILQQLSKITNGLNKLFGSK